MYLYIQVWITGSTQDWSMVATSSVQNTNGQTWLLSTDQNSLYRDNQIQWRKTISDPSYVLCQKRLIREFI